VDSPICSPQSNALTLDDLRQWRDDPVAFAVGALGVQPWEREAELLRAIASNDAVACRSGQKVSKSHALGITALWWVVTRPGDSRVILTAPSAHQVRNILWPEVRLLYLNAKVPLGGHLYQDPTKGLSFGEKWGIISITTDKAERMQGISSPRQMTLVDEASGYPEQLFPSIIGNLSGGGKVVMTGNPTQTSGTFYRAFHEGRGRPWKTMHIASTETPNFHGGKVPGLAGPEFIEFAKHEWGVESPLYQIRVLGEFPAQAADTVISVALLEAAQAIWTEDAGKEPLTIGLDVARFGDDETVMAPRRGLRIGELEAVNRKDNVDAAEWVVGRAQALRHKAEHVTVAVDVTGGGGVADVLRHMRLEWLRVVDVNSSEKADEPEEFVNRRAEMFFGLADWLRKGGALPHDDRLAGELVAHKYKFNKGRRQIEEKADIKKRLGRSPDRADAVTLSIMGRGTPLIVPNSTGSHYRLGDDRGF